MAEKTIVVCDTCGAQRDPAVSGWLYGRSGRALGEHGTFCGLECAAHWLCGLFAAVERRRAGPEPRGRN